MKTNISHYVSIIYSTMLVIYTDSIFSYKFIDSHNRCYSKFKNINRIGINFPLYMRRVILPEGFNRSYESMLRPPLKPRIPIRVTEIDQLKALINDG